MKFTQFYIKSEPYKGKVVLCNTMNESIVVLENEVLQSIEQNMEELEKYPEVKNYLIDNEFVIKDDIDEENNYMTALQNEHHSFGHLSRIFCQRLLVILIVYIVINRGLKDIIFFS